jgi:hypothetical protein
MYGRPRLIDPLCIWKDEELKPISRERCYPNCLLFYWIWLQLGPKFDSDRVEIHVVWSMCLDFGFNQVWATYN